jgi:hypothetical protein
LAKGCTAAEIAALQRFRRNSTKNSAHTIIPKKTNAVHRKAPCHGADGRGGGPQGSVLRKTAPDLTKLTLRDGGTFPRQRLERLIDGREEIYAHGSREMPVWGDWFKLEEEEAYEGPTEEEAKIRKRVEDLLNFLQSMQE